VDGAVVLRDEFEKYHRIKRDQLSDMADRALIDRGRTWFGRDGAPLFTASVRSVTGNRVQFNGRPATYLTYNFHRIDEEIFGLHRTAGSPPR
jgi:hypothetical protein